MATRPARLIPDSRCDFKARMSVTVVSFAFCNYSAPFIEIHTALGILGNTNNKSVGVE